MHALCIFTMHTSATRNSLTHGGCDDPHILGGSRLRIEVKAVTSAKCRSGFKATSSERPRAAAHSPIYNQGAKLTSRQRTCTLFASVPLERETIKCFLLNLGCELMMDNTPSRVLPCDEETVSALVRRKLFATVLSGSESPFSKETISPESFWTV